jgi:2,3,4,5-tetrahydropyridine-2-carboxylate N-succinyltransferase
MVRIAADLQQSIEELSERTEPVARSEALSIFVQLRDLLNRGEVRAAEPDAAEPLGWRVNGWVKRGILLGFEHGELVSIPAGEGLFSFVDKATLPLKRLERSDNVRVAPGGSAIRDGAYLAPGVICMPPMYINIGAYVGAQSLIDSHALVGSCAQIGRRVHVSAGAQIGGVLEPVGALPVIVEDEVLIGGNTGLYEGVIVRRGAVIGAGTILTRSTPLYDLISGEIITAGPETPLVVPEGAVVVPGARAVTTGRGPEWGLAVSTPVIVKYRDGRTAQRTTLEEKLR